jgi:hypothetical protein
MRSDLVEKDGRVVAYDNMAVVWTWVFTVNEFESDEG